ncbi:hypothetical protein C8A03DRAFT_15005, partial [Achaetomium macrosporum]
MENRSSESGAAFLVRGYNASLWDTSFGPFSLESLTPRELDSEVNVAPNSSADLAASTPTCASQAIRASRSSIRPGIGPIFNAFTGADVTCRVPPAPRADVTVSSSTLSSIAREYTAAQYQRISSPAQHQCVGHLICPVNTADAENLGLSPVTQNPHFSCPPLPLLETRVDSGCLPPQSIPYGTLFLTQPATLSHWTSPILCPNSIDDGHFHLSARDLTTTVDAIGADGDSGSGSSPVPCNPSSWPTTHDSPLSNSAVSQNTVNDGHGRTVSTVSTHVAVQVATAPDPLSSTSKRPRTSSPMTTFPIVHYKPSGCTVTKSPRKRPAFEEVVPPAMSSKALRQVLLQDEHGNVKGAMMTFGNRIKTRAVFSEEKRQRTTQARREGVCQRCKHAKRQCDLAQQQSLYISCSHCARTRIYKNAARFPCFRAGLVDVLFFRSGPASNEPFFTRRNTVYALGDLSKPDAPARTLKLTQHIGSHQLMVYASEFDPLPGDVICYKWRDRGQLRELKIPPFCLTNIRQVQVNLFQYIASTKWAYLKSLENEDELTWMTVSAAMSYVKTRPDSLVADALDLWAISRIIEIPWEMCGSDTLGVSPVRDPTSPHYRKILIPPMMDTQLDQIAIQLILNPLRDRVVRKFEQLITPAKPEAWWEIYLSAFILLNHIERLAKHSVEHARTHTMPSKFSNIPFLEGAFHTAKSILARFHFVCNGSAPLRLDWTSPKVASMARLEPDQVEFLQRTQAMIAARGS